MICAVLCCKFIKEYLDSSFWQVVWVSQFGCHVKSEVVRVLDGRVTQPNAERSTLFECLFQQQGFQKGVDFFSNVLQKNLDTFLWNFFLECIFTNGRKLISDNWSLKKFYKTAKLERNLS